MSHKSDDTRYASEIPSVMAWAPNYTSSEIEQAREIALRTCQKEYNANIVLAQKHQALIARDMERRGFTPVNAAIKWQANNNRNNNGSPADVVFAAHQVGGVSVKYGSDIIGNYGTAEFDRPKSVDLFKHLAPQEFDALLLAVKSDLLAHLKNVGDTWTAERDHDYGKYAIRRLSETTCQLKFGDKCKVFTDQELLTEVLVKIAKNGTVSTRNLPGKWRRVFGDYYQSTKKKYIKQRQALYNVLYPKIVDICKNNIFTNTERLYQLAGFHDKPYYVSDLYNDCIYFVPSKHQVEQGIRIEIVDKDQAKTFGSGFELGCKIFLNQNQNSATMDFYVCYNAGTFNRGPVVKIQNFKGKQNLWQVVA